MQEPEQAVPASHFIDQVAERASADNLLRTAQQHHVQLSVMADIKANILITTCSIVLTVSLSQSSNPQLKVSAMILLLFTSLALMLAILAVLPKYRSPRAKQTNLKHYNLLFFGHFAELPRERFLAQIAQALKPDGRAYETMANDLYSLGHYLANYKYPFLRWSYLFFLSGFLLASLTQLCFWLFHFHY